MANDIVSVLPEQMLTDCCSANYIDTTEHKMDGRWWGRCMWCKEMAELLTEEAIWITTE